LEALAAPAALALDADSEAWRNGRALRTLDTALEHIAIAGVSGTVALSWAAPVVSPEAATAAVQALRARYPADQWPGVERPLRDVLREHQRDGLVAALLGAQETSAALSARLLIDVDGAACRTTSRIEAAIGSVQTFVQRCLFGLEDRVRFDAEGAAEWTWMQRFDLWVAQRQLFLYPENWLHFDLRDDKTPFFVELEQKLGQGALTPERLETLYTEYLEQLDTVAKLDVCGCHHERGFDRHGTMTVDRLHVVARASADPRTYWYRRLESGSHWTPWEKIALDIDSEAVVVTSAEGRLYLCWPVIKEASEPEPAPAPPVLTTRQEGAPAPDHPDPPPARPPEPRKHLEIQLAYAERRSDGWGPRRQSDGLLRIDRRHREPGEVFAAAAAFWHVDPTVVTQVIGPLLTSLLGGEQRFEAALPDDVVFDPLPSADAIRLVAQPEAPGTAGAQRGRPEDDVELVVRCYVRRSDTRDIAVSVGEFRLGGCHGTFAAVPDTGRRRPALLAPSWLEVTQRGAQAYLREPEPRAHRAVPRSGRRGPAVHGAVPASARRSGGHGRQRGDPARAAAGRRVFVRGRILRRR
jgi:hypothetical protein